MTDPFVRTNPSTTLRAGIAEIMARAIRPYMAHGPDAGICARDIIAALHEAGLAIAPREPTEAMVLAGVTAASEYLDEDVARECWSAMLAAAPLAVPVDNRQTGIAHAREPFSGEKE
jgi:hypothetical protein